MIKKLVSQLAMWWSYKLWEFKIWKLRQTRNDYIIDVLGIIGIALIILGAIGIISKGLSS